MRFTERGKTKKKKKKSGREAIFICSFLYMMNYDVVNLFIALRG
jgi:hypothetical protein